MRSFCVVPWLACMAFLAGAPASAAVFSLGTSLGVATTHIYHEEHFVIDVPGSVGQDTPAFMPGLRFAVRCDDGRHSVVLDPGFSLLRTAGHTTVQTEALVSYQMTFTPTSATSGFVDVGAGVLYQDFRPHRVLYAVPEYGGYFEGHAQTNAVVGGGLGTRHRLAHGHGDIRAEFRLDRVLKDREQRYEATVVSIRFGFDLDVN